MWLGIDLGTSSVKVVIVDEHSKMHAQASAPLDLDRPRKGWSEQHPEAWWTAVKSAVSALPHSARRAVQGVGLTGQMHGAVLLDKHDKPIRPAILWNDSRSARECAELEALEPNSRSITGNLSMAGFTAPKLLWVRRHEPEIFKQTTKVLLPKDYVRLRMTGDYASDMSDSAGTLWLNVAARCWSERMLAACGLRVSHMPKLFEGPQITGQLSATAASELGLARVEVVAGGGDNAAGAIGVGVVAKGEGFLSLGTSGVIFAVSDGFAPNLDNAVHAFCHALPNRWHQMAVILSAASAVSWAGKLLGFDTLESAMEAANGKRDDDRMPVFLPYLSGERTPHNNPHAQGMFCGLGHSTDAGAAFRSVLEGVAFALADGLDALRKANTRVSALTVIGGGARSRVWSTILADALNCRLDYCVGAHTGPALGAARLACLGVTGFDARDVCQAPEIAHSIAPAAEVSPAFLRRRERFRATYRSLYHKTPPHS